MSKAPLTELVRSLRQTVEAYRLDSLEDAELLQRFRCNTDPVAFETIVRRHGERVLAACRKVLSDPADVEDAFQATFLVLLRNAERIRQQHSLGGWLYGVAHRIALQARRRATRRAGIEARKPTRTSEEETDLSWREACTILHEELDRLPDKYRLPLLLCYLEGKSRDETAQQLGVTGDVLRGQLARGREKLRGRLMKRGIALSAGLLALVANHVSAGSLSSNLVKATLTAATSQPSAAVAALMHGTSFAVGLGKIRLVDAALLFAGLLCAAGALRVYYHTGAQSQQQTNAVAPVEEPLAAVAVTAEPERQRLVTGRVTNRATGKPVSGWVEYRPLADNPNLKSAPPQHNVQVQLDRDGHFSIPILSGRGLLIVQAEGAFLPARLDEADRRAGVLDPKNSERLDTQPQPLRLSQFHACRVLDVPAAQDATCDLTVDPGRSLPLTVLTPDGKACAARALGLDPLPFDRGGELPDGRGVIRMLAEGERRRIFLQSTDKKFASVLVLSGQETETVTARLQPTGVITGRLVDANGKAFAGQSFQIAYDAGPDRPGVYFDREGFRYRSLTPTETERHGWIGGDIFNNREFLVGPEKTDEQGRFRIAGVFPNVAFDLKVLLTHDSSASEQKRVTIASMVKAGVEHDLGVLTAGKSE
jgi:RNA polymerase sigma factor (sigma-70 family)